MSDPITKQDVIRILEAAIEILVRTPSEEKYTAPVVDDRGLGNCPDCSGPLRDGRYGPFCSPCADERKRQLQKDWKNR